MTGPFLVTKYQGRWAVYDTVSRVYYFRKGKAACVQLAAELNA